MSGMDLYPYFWWSMDLYFFRLDKKTELSIAQQDFFLPVTQVWTDHRLYAALLAVSFDISYANTWIWRIELTISFVTGVPSLLLVLWLFFFVALDSDNSSQIHNTGLFRFTWTYLHVDSCCQSPVYIYISASIFDIPDSILKVLLLEWHCSTTFQDGTYLTGVFIEMFDWRRSVLTAQELIVNIWNTLAAQSAHSSLIARR